MRRWEQIKRFIHASPIVEEVPQERWFEKMQPLADQVQANFQRWVILATDVAIDEMMVKFKGRSKDTIRMREKPIKEGYKVFALSEHGYTWAFLFSSRVLGPVGLRAWANVRDLGFSKTDQTVVQLAGSLPSREFSFNIFFDNLFSNIPLFHALRSLDIGATGTVRPNSREYPTEFKFRGRGPIFPHNTVSGLVRRDVLAVLWQDKKLVRFLTTIHTLTSPSDYILVDRNRPRVTGANTELVRQGWGDEPFVAQRNPVVAVEYNQFMGSVDQDNQLRAAHACTLRSRRNWLPLLFWLLDISTDNAWLLARQFGTASLNQRHRDWMHRLSCELVDAGRQKMQTDAVAAAAAEAGRASTPVPVPPAPPPATDPDPAHPTRFKPAHQGHQATVPRGPYVSKRFGLPLARFMTAHTHTSQAAPRRQQCEFCRFIFHKHDGEARVDQLKRVIDCPAFFVPDKTRTTAKQCSFCATPLCVKFCFEFFHRVEVDTEGNITGCRPPLS
jgi:hypothetical protein